MSLTPDPPIPGLTIRPELPPDAAPITAVTLAAFSASPHGEEAIVTALRASSALTLSLVAVLPPSSRSPFSSPVPSPPREEPESDRIVGHVAFSPVQILAEPGAAPPPQKWVGLGPVSVSPAFQRRGIGAALIAEGLRILREEGHFDGCVVLGNPVFYGKFGFVVGKGPVLDGVPAKYFQALMLKESVEWPVGKVKYHEAFGV
ncbi:hypothetical protein VHEMI08143 [[Torrubiella] hemipterigena]|uniref:N-acetyltransferase domain-containing protein n=1 Tax=[Torrubiella] hemipterigena TaxID=1531966 RepID=A0A0A1TP57_9HYPO|nr:hypothetical protein VHEMI08143 [[Torrubiella] hemipterigena]